MVLTSYALDSVAVSYTHLEGIETQEDEALIQALKCNFGQGYFYDKPMSAKEFSQRYMKKDEK